jgi:hypothetical protein
MPTLHLNDIQCWKLFSFLQTQGRGGPHLRRMQRLRQVLDIDRIEDIFEKNQDTIDEFRVDGKAVPKAKLTSLRADDPQRQIPIDLGDLDKINARIVAAWDKEIEPDPGKEIDPLCRECGRSRETMDDRIYLPILETVKAAWAEVEEQKAVSKSVPAQDQSSNNATANS